MLQPQTCAHMHARDERKHHAVACTCKAHTHFCTRAKPTSICTRTHIVSPKACLPAKQDRTSHAHAQPAQALMGQPVLAHAHTVAAFLDIHREQLPRAISGCHNNMQACMQGLTCDKKTHAYTWECATHATLTYAHEHAHAHTQV